MEHAPTTIGRYEIYGTIARGGMATIRLAKLLGDAGFSRVVAVKHLHEHVADDPEFVKMLLDEARVASRVRHPKVVAILDVVSLGDQVFLVMDYVHGESLSDMLRMTRAEREPVPPDVAVSILCDALEGLHAAHQAVDELGRTLGIVHRDVSPRNILVGADGVGRILDFGIAKSTAKLHTTRKGTMKGTLPYMAPEILRGEEATARSDIHAAGCVLWEALTGQRLFSGDSEAAIFGRVLEGVRRPPSAIVSPLPPALDAVVLKAIARDPTARHADAQELAEELRAALAPAATQDVAAWVTRLADTSLRRRAALVASVERGETWSEPLERRWTADTRTAMPAADEPTTASTVALASGPDHPRRSIGLVLAALAVAAGGVVAYAVSGEESVAVVARGGALTVAPSLASPSHSASPEPSDRVSVPTAVTPPVAQPPAHPLPRPSPAPRVPDCNPPVVRDANGILRVKPGCDGAGRR